MSPACDAHLCDGKLFPYKGRSRDLTTQSAIGVQPTAKLRGDEDNPPTHTLLHRRYLIHHRDLPRPTSFIHHWHHRVSVMEPSSTPGPVNGTNGNHDELLEPTTQFDVSLFRSYLSALLPPVVGALPDELDDVFESGDFDETVSKFAAKAPT